MKIFKTAQYPTMQKFLVVCENYKIYLSKRGRGENLKPRLVDEQVKKYVAALIKAERLKQDSPEIEFINLTVKEYRKKEDEEKRREEQEKFEREQKEKEVERRKDDLKKAAEDPEFKKSFMRAELAKAGITIDRQVEEMVAERYDGKRNQDFWSERRRVQESLENEIKEAR